ncbi:hypothetical protein TgHK011_003023 [Trichoderma gracile]|nr:hypothetical protein TgHK011_003023 [Trichoderma gracile]
MSRLSAAALLRTNWEAVYQAVSLFRSAFYLEVQPGHARIHQSIDFRWDRNPGLARSARIGEKRPRRGRAGTSEATRRPATTMRAHSNLLFHALLRCSTLINTDIARCADDR